MEVKKTIFYDVSGRDDEIYMQHFKSDGFVQDWLHFHVKYELTLVLCGQLGNNQRGQGICLPKAAFPAAQALFVSHRERA